MSSRTSSKRSVAATDHPARLGARLGPRLATILSDTLTEHLQRSGPHRAKLAAEGANEFFRGVGAEKRQNYSPLLDMFVGRDGVPAELDRALRFMAHGEGEASEIVSMLATAQGVSTPISAAIANWLAPTNQFYIAQSPHAVLSPGDAAQATRAGLAPFEWAESEAAKGGFDAYRFGLLSELAIQWPGLGELLELWRRKAISEADVKAALQRSGLDGAYVNLLPNLKRVYLQPADGALMALRGIIDTEKGHEIAAHSGLDAADFDLLVEATGEPPGLMQLLEAFRRGFIDDARLEKGVRQSRVRDEWIDVVKKLRFTPASTADAVSALVQNHLDHGRAKQVAEQNGLDPADFDWLVEVNGNPPSPTQLYDLLNRHVIGEAEVKQGLREGRLKDKYIDSVVHLRRRILPERQVMQLVTRGAINTAGALRMLEEYGYDAHDADAIAYAGIHAQTQRERPLTAGEITKALTEGLIADHEARVLLEGLGYHAASVELLLRSAALHQEIAYRRQAVAQIRSAYVARHIAIGTASSDLDRLGVDAAQRDYLLSLWEVDQAAHTKSLTEAQIIKANTLGLLTDDAAEQRLQALGYDLFDTRILLDSEKGRSSAAP